VPEGRTSQRIGSPPSRDGGTQTSTPTDGGPLTDGGPTVDAGPETDAGPVMAYCGDQTCDANESCMSCVTDCGPCQCPSGFILHNSRCAPESPEPFVSRLESDVCGKWRSEFVTNVGTEWTETFGSMDPCDPGEVSEGSHANAIRRTNLYRWLSGLGQITENPDRRGQQQDCAVVMHGLGSLDHTPPDTTPCWTQSGYDGSSSSNLAQAGGGLARSVDLYVGDRGVDSLGHRRWVLNPSMVDTTFGYKPPFSCMYSFSRGGNTPQDVQAYPPPGHVPEQAAPGLWSFRMDSMSFVAESTTVELDIDDTGYSTVDSWVVGGGYGAGPVLAWDAPTGTWSAGKTVRVRLTNANSQSYSYTVVFVDCN